MNNPLTILHINTERGMRGGEHQVAYLMKSLNRWGYNNILMAPPEAPLVNRVSKWCTQIISASMRNEADVSSILTLSATLRDSPVDVIHAHTARAHGLAAIAKSLTRRTIPLIVSRRVQFSIKKHFWNRMKYHFPDRYIAISQASAQTLLDIGVDESKISIVYSGVDANRFKKSNPTKFREELGIDENDYVIGTMGAYDEKKGQGTIIEAAAHLLKSYPNFRFIIVGKGKLRKKYKKRIKELGIQDRFHLTGFRDDLQNIYPCFDLFLMTSLEEGLCTAIMEAQLFGIPVIATQVGGIPEVILDGKTGCLITPNNVEKLIQAVQQVHSDSRLAKKFSKKGRQRIKQNFTSKAMARHTLQIYQELIADVTDGVLR